MERNYQYSYEILDIETVANYYSYYYTSFFIKCCPRNTFIC